MFCLGVERNLFCSEAVRAFDRAVLINSLAGKNIMTRHLENLPTDQSTLSLISGLFSLLTSVIAIVQNNVRRYTLVCCQLELRLILFCPGGHQHSRRHRRIDVSRHLPQSKSRAAETACQIGPRRKGQAPKARHIAAMDAAGLVTKRWFVFRRRPDGLFPVLVGG